MYVLRYTTLKLVTIRDRRLGILHYASMLGIAAYIIYSVVIDQLYLKTESPVGG
jgi:hypothetical protein